MKLDTALEEMEIVLNELNEQIETIKENEVRVPQIEIDIIKATIRRLYESVDHLNKQRYFEDVETVKESNTEVSDVEPKKETASIVEEVILEKPQEKNEKEAVEETPSSNEIVDYEKITDDLLEEINALEEDVVNEFEESDLEDKKEAKEVEKSNPSLLLQFEDEIFSVNESIAQKNTDKSLVNKLSNTRIENLKSAIGINDKFYFINELFSGNSQVYEDVIYALNNFKRFEEAMQYISTIKHKYDWNTESEAYQKLIHFLERKFVEIHA
ncbi:MAG: hypothetical protein J7K39_11765 [Bacteroidales bacterium]|nr:hypothetical protein [Bacteroidales bacterium]